MSEPLPAGGVPAPVVPGGAGWRRALAAYGLTLVVCLLLLTCVLQLWRAKLSVPLAFGGDAVLHQVLIKRVVEHGWQLRNGDPGALGGLETYDFATADHLHFLIERLIGLIDPRPAVVFNVYYLLTFPLAALAALFALRRFRVGYPAAVVASLLFAFLPYHLSRLGQLHLAAYYVIPLTVLVVLRLYLGQLPLFRLEPGPHGRRWHPLSAETLGALLVCVLTGLSGVYYAFFACFLLAVAGVASAWFRRRLAPLAVAAVLAGVVAVTVGASLAPAARSRREHGPNPLAEDTRRHHGESELGGLKLAQLLLPATGHRFPPLAALKARYNAPPTPLVTENDLAALGLLGSFGFVLLLGRLLPLARGGRRLKPLDALAGLTLAATLLATIGGFGTLFALLVNPTLRCYNRISVYLGFFALFALAVVLDRLVRRWAGSRARVVGCWGGLAVLLVLGVLDQTCPAHVPPYEAIQAEHRTLREFVRRVEASVPAAGMIHQLPYTPFLDAPPERMGPCDHLRPYLVSRKLHWACGPMRGREGDSWHRFLQEQPLEEQVRRLSLVGFAGICVDRNGFADGGRQTEAELARLLGPPPLVSADNRRSFFPLGKYTQAYRRGRPTAEWEGLRRRALCPVEFRWRNGFYPEDRPPGPRWRWCASSGELALVNRSAHPRKVTLEMICMHPSARPAPFRIWGGLLNLDGLLDERGRKVAATLTVPPGEHTVRFRCDGPRHPFPDQHEHERVFVVIDFRGRELD
jgi:phosphoglycerol transferase